jgi:hypothetical protein
METNGHEWTETNKIEQGDKRLKIWGGFRELFRMQPISSETMFPVDIHWCIIE